MKNAFSLIELMVATTIIAVLATVGLTSFGSTQNKARDAKIRQDVNTIASALEQHLDPITFKYIPIPQNQTDQKAWFSDGLPKTPTGGDYNGLFFDVPRESFSICGNLSTGQYCKASLYNSLAQITPTPTTGTGGPPGSGGSGSGTPVSTVACADGTVEQNYSAKMGGCNGSVTHTQAASLCNTSGGWEVCPAQLYLDRGGKTTPSNNSSRWLSTMALRNNPSSCSSNLCGGSICTKINSGGTENAATASNQSITSAYVNSCSEINSNTIGYIYNAPTADTLGGTVCCTPPFSYNLTTGGSSYLNRGTSTNNTITVNRDSGAPQPVSLSATGPAGITFSFNPITCTPDATGHCSSTLTITANSNIADGTYTITVKGTSLETADKTTTFSLKLPSLEPPIQFYAAPSQEYNTTNLTMKFRWFLSPDDYINHRVSDYKIESCLGASCTNFQGISSTSPGISEYSLPSQAAIVAPNQTIAPSTTYRFRMYAASTTGLSSAYTPIISATTPPSSSQATCSSSSPPQNRQVYSNTMILCGTQLLISANNASSLCGAGSHFCNISEFVSRGGNSVVAVNSALINSTFSQLVQCSGSYCLSQNQCGTLTSGSSNDYYIAYFEAYLNGYANQSPACNNIAGRGHFAHQLSNQSNGAMCCSN